MLFLPPPESKLFPEQALGLQLLIDQAPRLLFQGVNSRWVGGYFDIISLDLAKRFASMPDTLKAYNLNRWAGGVGATFGFWAVARFWFLAPLVYSESLATHDLADELIESTRLDIEKFAGKTDPYRSSKKELMKNVYGFPTIIKAGFPQKPDLKMEEFLFWLAMLLDLHYPIINVYDRYPYRNASLGRESTQEEKEWLDATDHFGEEGEEAAKKIRGCVGWTMDTIDRWQTLMFNLIVNLYVTLSLVFYALQKRLKLSIFLTLLR
ncbi:hypothetical protein B7463_g10266, partial [Scytalidium lignicola]